MLGRSSLIGEGRDTGHLQVDEGKDRVGTLRTLLKGVSVGVAGGSGRDNNGSDAKQLFKTSTQLMVSCFPQGTKGEETGTGEAVRTVVVGLTYRKEGK